MRQYGDADAERPAGVKVKLRLTAAAGAADERRRRLQASGVPPHLVNVVERLKDHEAAVLKWLAADDRRAAEFLLDPVKALAGSGIEFGDGLLSSLERERDRRGGDRKPPREASGIGSITVTAKAKHRP